MFSQKEYTTLNVVLWVQIFGSLRSTNITVLPLPRSNRRWSFWMQESMTWWMIQCHWTAGWQGCTLRMSSSSSLPTINKWLKWCFFCFVVEWWYQNWEEAWYMYVRPLHFGYSNPEAQNVTKSSDVLLIQHTETRMMSGSLFQSTKVRDEKAKEVESSGLGGIQTFTHHSQAEMLHVNAASSWFVKQGGLNYMPLIHYCPEHCNRHQALVLCRCKFHLIRLLCTPPTQKPLQMRDGNATKIYCSDWYFLGPGKKILTMPSQLQQDKSSVHIRAGELCPDFYKCFAPGNISK